MNDTRFKKGMAPWNKGIKCPQIAIHKMGDKNPSKRIEVREKIRKTLKGRKVPLEVRLKMSKSNMGKKHHAWKGGVTPINEKIRKSFEYKLWREAVYKRDNWTCVFCEQRGVKLNADHIKPFAHYPELRFAIDNGRTLCKPCHRTTDTYGRLSNNHKKHD